MKNDTDIKQEVRSILRGLDHAAQQHGYGTFAELAATTDSGAQTLTHDREKLALSLVPLQSRLFKTINRMVADPELAEDDDEEDMPRKAKRKMHHQPTAEDLERAKLPPRNGLADVEVDASGLPHLKDIAQVVGRMIAKLLFGYTEEERRFILDRAMDVEAKRIHQEFARGRMVQALLANEAPTGQRKGNHP